MRRRSRHPPRITAAPLMPIVGCILSLTVLAGCKQLKEPYDRGFKASFQASFVKSCTASAVSNGAPESSVRPLCECVAKHLVDHRSSAELIRVSANQESVESKNILSESTIACTRAAATTRFDQKLYDKGFRASFQANFVRSCTASAVSNGANETSIKPLCECAARYLVDHHSPGELTRVSTNPESTESERILSESTAACASAAAK